MDSLARTDTVTATYAVKVSGFWHDPRTRSESPHTETFLVAARSPQAALLAGEQLFSRTAAEHRFRRSGRCHAVAEPG